MFEKDASLNQINGLVIPKSGSFDGSYVAAGTCNIIFFVTPGKGRSYKRDRTCINNATKICEHVIVVAKNCGNLPDFVQCFKRSKVRPSLTSLALNGAHQNWLEKNLADNDRSMSNINFQSLDHFPGAFHVTHPTMHK